MELYNKHRPRKPEDMFLTSPIIEALPILINETVKDGKDTLPHVMLFISDTPGLGKTTLGRIIASELNPDISEAEREAIFRGFPNDLLIERGASESNKSEIVELEKRIEALAYSMHTDRRYVFMLNEVHAITTQTQRILLDSFSENIPDNVYVILTTTEPEKLREDLRSRFQAGTYTFHGPSDEDKRKIIQNTCDKESFIIEDKIVDRIIATSDGSIRTLIGTLQNYMSSGYTGIKAEVQNDTDEYTAAKTFILRLIDAGERPIQPNTKWADIKKLSDAVCPDKNIVAKRSLLSYIVHNILTWNEFSKHFKSPHKLEALNHVIDFVTDEFIPSPQMYLMNLYKTYYKIREKIIKASDEKPKR